MRCYVDEPCEALQVQGMMASFFFSTWKQLQGMFTNQISQCYLAWNKWKGGIYSLNQTELHGFNAMASNAWWIWIMCDTVLEISTCTHASVRSIRQVQIIDHSPVCWAGFSFFGNNTGWKSLAWMASAVKIQFPTSLHGYWTPYLPGHSTLCVWYFLFFSSSELKPVVPAHSPSLSSSGIPFKGAVWSLLHDALEVNFLKCKSHDHSFGFPAEPFFLVCAKSFFKYSVFIVFWICASKSEERSFWYVNLLTCGLDRNKTYNVSFH